MSNKITFKQWLANLWQGVWQAICWVGRCLNPKYKTPFWRVIWVVITVCIVAFTCMIGYAFYDEVIRRSYNRLSWEERYDSNLSPNFKYRNNGYNEGKSYIYDSRTKAKIIKDIDWIAVPEDGDSLIIVAKDGKRGFVNRYTAETVIPFKYDAAWSFTDGVAGVCEGDSVYFIDHSGKPIHNRRFARERGYNRYIYHGNYAAIPVNGKYGLLDRNGKWAFQPEHEDIHIGAKNMWYAMDNGKWGVIGTNGQFVIPMEYKNVFIHSYNGITIVKDDNSQSRHDYDGAILDDFVFDEVYHLAYYINEFDEEGNQKKAVDNMMSYSANNFYGLINRAGVPVTPPLYSSIESVAPGVYQCQIPETDECIMVNAKGDKINE